MYIIVKKSDYTKDDLIEKLQDYCVPEYGEEINEYGTWETCDYMEVKDIFYCKCSEYFGDWDITMRDVIEYEGYRIGDDNEFYQKVGTKYSEFNIKGIKPYYQAKEICSQNDDQLTGFIEDGKLYFTKDECKEQDDCSLCITKEEVKDCPFADNEEVYFIECCPKYSWE